MRASSSSSPRMRTPRMRGLTTTPERCFERIHRRRADVGPPRDSPSPASPPSLRSDSSPAHSAETWRGLTVAPEHRCAPYDKKRDYPYPQSVERDIVRELGAVYGPYTGTCFASARETDIEHIVAASEAHDSGLVRSGCGDQGAVRARPSQPHARLTAGEPPREERQGRRAVAPGPESLLVRSTGARGPPGLRAHHRSARSAGARPDIRCLRNHGARARAMRAAVCLSECARSRSRRR